MWLLMQKNSRADTGTAAQTHCGIEDLGQGEILINHLVMLLLC